MSHTFGRGFLMCDSDDTATGGGGKKCAECIGCIAKKATCIINEEDNTTTKLPIIIELENIENATLERAYRNEELPLNTTIQVQIPELGGKRYNVTAYIPAMMGDENTKQLLQVNTVQFTVIETNSHPQ